MKLGIIGYGVVGKAIDNTFSEYCDVIKYDKYFDYNSFEDICQSHFLFIVVPTPFDCQLNMVDTSAIDESLDKLSEKNYSGIVIIKSTIPPGTCDYYNKKHKLNIVFNPEFLRESTTPNEDFRNQHSIVIGTESEIFFKSVKDLYIKAQFHDSDYYHTSFTESEMIKYAQNTTLASRVALSNIIFDACNKFKIDYDKVREIAFDRFDIIGPSMVKVPGPDGSRGFGGKCLPKDIMGFSTIHDSDVLLSIIKYNDKLRNDLDKVLKNYQNK